MYLGRKCFFCGHTRIPSEEVVAEKKVKYVIYTCPICHLKDIDRISDLPQFKLWNGSEFEQEYRANPYREQP